MILSKVNGVNTMINRIKHSFRVLAMALAIMLSPFALSASNTIDVLVVYTQGVVDLYGGNPNTRINQLFQFTNQIYSDSQLDVSIRVVKTRLVNYTDDNSADTALRAITNGEGVFGSIETLRKESGADMVILYRPFRQVHGSCGLAWIGGVGTNGNFSQSSIKSYMYSHIAIDSCGDFVTAHELDHNMGLKHSREQDGSGGTLPYALGYGVMNKFTTVMAYQNIFNVDYWTGKIYKFSSPRLVCGDEACGVDKNDNQRGADARSAIAVTAPQIAEFYASTYVDAEIALIQEQVALAKAMHEAATKALADNQAAIAQKTKQQASAKVQLDKVSAILQQKTQGYQDAVVQYNAAIKTLTELHQAASGTSTRTKRFRNSSSNRRQSAEDNAARAAYQQYLKTFTGFYIGLAQAKSALTVATGAVATATRNYTAAQKALATEQSRTADLQAAVNETSATYNELLSEQSALLKQSVSF